MTHEHFEHHGRVFKWRLEDDEDHGTPWENDQGRGVVSDRTDRDKRPGERILWQAFGVKRYFNITATMKKAREQGWGLTTEKLAELALKLGRLPTKAQVLAAAIEQEFNFLYDWCHDKWRYVGVIVTDIQSGDHESLWGIESNSEDYIEEVVVELASQIHPLAEAHEAANLEVCTD